MATDLLEILIVGAGFSGIGTAIQLRRQGIENFKILERADEVGGTWRDNTYPGAACDVPSHLYSLSFAPNPNWSKNFAGAQEIQDYIIKTTVDGGVRSKIDFGKELVAGAFNPEIGIWEVQCKDGSCYRARNLILGLGPLANPSYPSIPGIEEFEGCRMHSARWDHAYNFSGKNVGVIGTGASAIQIIPELAKVAAKLTVFQRSAPWILPRPNKKISERVKRLYRDWPFLRVMYRWYLHITMDLHGPFIFSNRKLFKKYLENFALSYMKRKVTDPELRRKITPRYRIGCKRVLISSDYYPALNRKNVELTTNPIKRITKTGILMENGDEYSMDALVFSTGFSSATINHPIDLRNGSGQSLAEKWRDGSYAYKGMSIDGFPNLYFLVGPNTGPGHTSVLVYLETQIQYVIEAINYCKRKNLTAIAVKPSVIEKYNRWVAARMARMVWTKGGCHSWYLTPTGENRSLYPGFASEYCLKTRFKASEYHN